MRCVKSFKFVIPEEIAEGEEASPLFVPFARLILLVSTPLLLSSVVNVLIQFSNTYFMGHATPEALYLVALYIPISFLMLAIVEGICVTNQVIVAKKTGQGSLFEMPAISFSLTVTGMGILGALALSSYAYGAKVIPHLFAISPALGSRFVPFLTAMFATSMLTIPGMILDSTLRGMGRTGLAFGLLLGYAAVYMGLLFHFTNGLGMQELAIPYATVSASLAFFLATLIAVRVVTAKEIPVWKLFFHPEAFIVLRYVGIPVALSHLLIFVSTFFYNRILAPFGEDVVSGFGVAFRIQTLIILPALTFGEGISILMNQKMGAGRPKEAYLLFRTGVILCFSLYAFLSLAISLAGEALPALLTPNAVVIREAVEYIRAVAPTYCWMGVLLTVLLILEQTDNGFRAFALNLVYFVAIIGIGYWVTREWRDPRYFFQTIAYGNLMGLSVIAWEWRRQKQKFEGIARAPRAGLATA